MRESYQTSRDAPVSSGVYSTQSQGGAADPGVAIRPGAYRRISWGAVFGGVVLALALQLLLSMLGIGVGMMTVDPAQTGGTPAASSLGMGAGIWWTVSYMIALGIGGYVAARLAGVFMKGDGVIHGLLTWAFALLVSAYLVSSAVSGVLNRTFNALGTVASGVSQTVQQTAPQLAQATGISPDQLRERAEGLLRQGGGGAATDPRTQIVQDLTTIARGGPDADPARQRAVSTISREAGIPEDQARQRLQDVEQQITQTTNQVSQTATQAAETTTDALSQASIGGAISLILGALAAAIGGRAGTRRREELATVG